MIVLVVEAPAPLVSLEIAKQHLEVDHDDRDDLIDAYIAAASGHIDGPDGYLGRALGVQTLEARFDAFPCGVADAVLKLPFPPLIDIVSVKFDDAAGVEQTLVEGDDFEVLPYGIRPTINGAWPPTYLREGAVRIRFRAGYAADAEADPLKNAPPKPIVAATLLIIGDLFANRETVVKGSVAFAIPMSATVERLLAPFRVWSI